MSKQPKKDRASKSSAKTQNFHLRDVVPLTESQEAVWDAWEAGKHLFLTGSAGTGKTFVALFLALQEGKKVLVVRSAVPSRNVGFLPGNLREKAEVYEEPYRDICNYLYQRGDAYETLKTKGLIDFCLTSYMRGITISNATVIVDETQNLGASELGTIITRAGEGTQFIFAGDYVQSDLRGPEKREILTFSKILSIMPSFKRVKFGIDDIVRSGIVKEFLIAREQVEKDESPEDQQPMGFL